MDLTIMHRLGIALALGLVVGTERGWQARESTEGLRNVGIRTFGLVGLLGGIAGVLAEASGIAVVVAIFAGLSVMITATYVLSAVHTGDYGVTTEVATLLTFGFGVMTGRGYIREAAAAAVVTTVILGAKPFLHRTLERIEPQELYAILQLLLIAVVVVPLLPNRSFGPWETINPWTIGLFVLLIAALSFIGYFAVKLLGSRIGLLLTALLGALTSSTAVTLTFARLAQQRPDLCPQLGAGIALAAGTMAVRVLVEVMAVHPALARVLAAPLVAMTLVPWVAVLVMLCRATPRLETETLPLRNPLELGLALWYALLLAVLFMLTRALHVWLGEPGVYLLAAVSGLADVDAVSLSLARMAWHDVALAVASHAIVIAVVTNTAIKALLASVVGGWALARWVVPILLGTLLVGAALAFYA
jgi:uncharacterized membrane protein (DUF4010 family)